MEERLFKLGVRTCLLDGDNVRSGLSGDLGFSLEDRHEHIRRVSEVSKLMVACGIVTLAAFISLLKCDRNKVRNLLSGDLSDYIKHNTNNVVTTDD